MRHVMAVRVSKAVLVFASALLYTILVLDNITDYDSNYQFVRHVLMMDSTSPGNHGMWRGVDPRGDGADDEPADVVGGVPRCRGRVVSDVAVAKVEWAGSGIPNVYDCRYGVFDCGATRANSRLVGYL